MSELSVNDVIIKLQRAEVLLVKYYQAKSLDQKRTASNLILDVANLLLSSTVDIHKMTAETIDDEMASQPRLTIVE